MVESAHFADRASDTEEEAFVRASIIEDLGEYLMVRMIAVKGYAQYFQVRNDDVFRRRSFRSGP
jgi:hypothetical protein